MSLAVPKVMFPVPKSTDLLSRIGNTPLVRLTRIERDCPGVEIYAKAEFFNPGGSVKDRPALNMIMEGEASGKLRPGKILLDATSGNTGIAYAMIGAIKGIRVRLAMPENVTPERKRILAAYGAELVQTSGREGSGTHHDRWRFRADAGCHAERGAASHQSLQRKRRRRFR